MVEEKDTELGKSKMKETEAVALAKSLVCFFFIAIIFNYCNFTINKT